MELDEVTRISTAQLVLAPLQEARARAASWKDEAIAADPAPRRTGVKSVDGYMTTESEKGLMSIVNFHEVVGDLCSASGLVASPAQPNSGCSNEAFHAMMRAISLHVEYSVIAKWLIKLIQAYLLLADTSNRCFSWLKEANKSKQHYSPPEEGGFWAEELEKEEVARVAGEIVEHTEPIIGLTSVGGGEATKPPAAEAAAAEAVCAEVNQGDEGKPAMTFRMERVFVKNARGEFYDTEAIVIDTPGCLPPALRSSKEEKIAAKEKRLRQAMDGVPTALIGAGSSPARFSKVPLRRLRVISGPESASISNNGGSVTEPSQSKLWLSYRSRTNTFEFVVDGKALLSARVEDIAVIAASAEAGKSIAENEEICEIVMLLTNRTAVEAGRTGSMWCSF